MKISIDCFSQEIKNHNADGLCSQEYCSNSCTEFQAIAIGETKYYLVICNRHADLIREALRQ